MISPQAPQIALADIQAGDAVFCVKEKSQHAGIASQSGPGGARLDVYAVARSRSIREVWNAGSGSPWVVTVTGWVSGQAARDDIRGHVLRECDRIEALVQEAVDRRSRPCCWQIRNPTFLCDEATATIVFSGSCAGFLQHCYRVAGVELVHGDLPVSTYTSGEIDDILEEYERANNAIRRLYPSYQIRAFQLDQYPWVADLRYRWYPEGFY